MQIIFLVQQPKSINTPFLIITISLIVGIVTGHYFCIAVIPALIALCISIAMLTLFWWKSKKPFKQGWEFVASAIVMFVVFGITLVNLHNPLHRSNHYSRLLPKKQLQQSVGVKFSVKERLKSTSYYQKYVVDIVIIHGKSTQGKLLLLLPKDSLRNHLDIGNRYTTFTQIKSIPKALNPDQFDYAAYLKKQYITHQIKLHPSQLVQDSTSTLSIFRLSDQVRKHIILKLKTYSFSTKQLAVIQALLLGQRQDIDQQTIQSYRDAGAMHILAVSGLHVGILLLLLNTVLRPLERFHQKGKVLKTVLLLVFLWFFAIIAGLSPSVLRAVTMFSFLAVGMQISSTTSMYNTLILSAFVLLCFHPLLLFSIGFQFSYVAVFSIVYLQPIFSKWYTPPNFLLKKIWETLTVTFSAQLGLAPLTIFYFHQFPLLFFVSNLIIIPFLGSILGLGVVVIVLASIGILPEPLVTVFGYGIDFMNGSVSWVASKSNFVLTNIPFSWRLLILSYTLIIAISLALQKALFKRRFVLGTVTIIIVLVIVFEKHQAAQQNELVIFHQFGNTVIGRLEHQQLILNTKSPITDNTQNFLFSNYLIKKRAVLKRNDAFQHQYQHKKRTLMVIDSTFMYSQHFQDSDILLLSGSPRIHLERIIDSLNPKQLVADGSNYRNYMDRWEKTCADRDIPFHRTDRDGAFVLK